MKKYRLPLLPLIVLALQAPVFAAENDSPNTEMDSLITAGSFQQAFDLGAANLEEWEGDPEFDFLYGFAALESDNPNESVFALERVVTVSEDSVLRGRARLELARAYFVTNNLTASENLFNQVLASNPPTNVQQNIEAFLQLIETRRDARDATFSFTLSSDIGDDDNINSATSNGLIDTPLIGQIELDEDGQESDDTFSSTTFVAAYNYPFDRNSSLGVTVNLTHLNNFDTDAFDIDALRSEVAYNWGSETNRFKHGVSYSKMNLDQKGFQDSVALNSSWQRSGGNGWYQSLAASYSQISYDTGSGRDQNDLRDVDQWLITAGLTKISGPFTHSFNLYTADEDPDESAGDHNGRDFTGLAYSVLWRLNAQHTPYLRISTQDVEHDSEHPVFFNTERDDDTDSFAFGWFWQIQRNLLITAEASYTDNGSNIELFDYSRFKYQAGIRYQF
jgi:tetratricopeptide (TPR) repeat protein|tara:strand:+ start:351 stop:1694 length:1344 start_codon:yes stop_codon:yes gene_type:complete